VALRLRNTLSRRVEPVVPLEPAPPGSVATIRMYSCGPTVYRSAHVGNMRTYLLADFLRRALLFEGFDVFHVQNITDVGHMRDEQRDAGGDKILAAAEREGRPPREIADAYEAEFHADQAALNILPAHVFPRATEHVTEMISLAEELEDRGTAYRAADGTLYYEVARFPGYGRLSGNSVDELRAGHRGPVEQGKRDPADFALWKVAEPGRRLKWSTRRWGDGFPGWHLECSAMARRYLGDRFEVHTGGIDNVFPHHEDEIAQSAAVTGSVPAAHWVHGEHLLMSGRKMAKSAGNIATVGDLVADDVDPLAFRYLCLTAHYSHKLNLSVASLRAAAAGLDSLRGRLRSLGPAPDEGVWAAPSVLDSGRTDDRPEGVAMGARGHGGVAPNGWPRRTTADPPLSAAGGAIRSRFREAVRDDLDLPRALAVVREALKPGLDRDEARWLVLDADAVLGLRLDRVWSERRALPVAAPTGDVPDLVAARSRARRDRDFVEADRLRDEIRDRGYELVDRSDGSTEVLPAGARRP
jgi:cysteinyl-tRNA synthetase